MQCPSRNSNIPLPLEGERLGEGVTLSLKGEGVFGWALVPYTKVSLFYFFVITDIITGPMILK
jgi:hypothetical protein